MEVKGQTGLEFIFIFIIILPACLVTPGEEKIHETTNQFGMALGVVLQLTVYSLKKGVKNQVWLKFVGTDLIPGCRGAESTIKVGPIRTSVEHCRPGHHKLWDIHN